MDSLGDPLNTVRVSWQGGKTKAYRAEVIQPPHSVHQVAHYYPLCHFIIYEKIKIFNCYKSAMHHDEDIPSTDTAMPTSQQRLVTRARARQLNYQLKSFLAVQTSHPPSAYKTCDDFLMIRNSEHEPDYEPDWRMD